MMMPISSFRSSTDALSHIAVDWYGEFHHPQYAIAPYVYRKVCTEMCRRVRQQAFELLEPLTLKGVRAVLRGGGGGNATFLPDRLVGPKETQMYCPSCGKQTPDNSAFCLHCGKPISASASVPTTTEWEFDNFVYRFPSGYIWARLGSGAYTEAGAKLEFWQDSQDRIWAELQMWLDEGWEPIGEVGSPCIKIRTYRAMAKSLGEKLWALTLTLVSFGLYLLVGWSYYAEPIDFQLKMRRPKSNAAGSRQHAKLKVKLEADNERRELESSSAYQLGRLFQRLFGG